jgi:hypothetical protein
VSGSPLCRKGNRAARHSEIEIAQPVPRHPVLAVELSRGIDLTATLGRSVYAEGLTYGNSMQMRR